MRFMRQLTIIVFLVFSCFSYGQVKVKGVVKDSIGTPLELANVIAINSTTNTLESYAISNDKGVYELVLTENGSFKLQVSYIGFKTFEELLLTKEEDFSKDIILQEDNALDAVELTYEMPVTVQGDTIVYNADSFKNGTERKLEDVLEKLPGVEITEDGNIEVEGQRVQKVMVDGKDFFDGDTKLAAKNIPSNVVDKIQVLKNYSEQRQLSGVRNNQDNIAINIKLKEGKTNFWFGDVTLGGGASTDEELYVVQPKLFYYSPKYSLNFIGDLNNTGEPALTGRDLRSFGGGFRPPSQNSGTNINLGNNALNFLTLQNDQAENIVSKLAASNFAYSPNENLDLSGFAIFNSSRIDLRETNFVQYTDPELGIPDETTVQDVRQGFDVGILKLSASYAPNFSNQLDYDVLGRLTKEVQSQNFNSSVLGDTDQFEENNPYSINQNLNYYLTLNERNILAFEMQHLWQDEDPFYNAIISEKDSYESTAESIGLDENQLNYNIAQDRRIKTNQFDGKVDYYNVLTSKSNLNLFFGTILSRQDFDSRIFQFLDDGETFEPTPPSGDLDTTNDVRYNFSDVYAGARYTLKTGKFTLAPAVSFHSYVNKNFQQGLELGDNFFRVLPELDIRFQIKNSESLTLRYTMQNEFTDVTNLAQGLVFNNFNSLFTGNGTLENGLSQNINLRYLNFNLFNFTNIFAIINYSSRVDQVRNITDFESVISSSTVFNSPFADESLTAFGRYQRTWGKIRGEMQVNFNYSKFNQIIAGNRSTNEQFTQTYRPGIRTNFRKAPNINVRYGFTIQDVDQGTNRNKIYINAPTAELDAYIWKSLTFRTDYSYNSVDDGNQTNSFDLWNASLSYRKGNTAKWEYELRATNLLNTGSRVTTNAGNVSLSIREYFIQPRFVTFRFVYTL